MRNTFLLIFCFLIKLAFAQQQYALSELLDSALSRNIDLKKLELEIEKATRQDRSYNGIGSTSVNYTYGQIDGPDQDYQWQIIQPVGNPLAAIANAQLRDARIANQELNYELNREWMQMKLHQAYASWQAWYRIREIREEIKLTYGDAVSVAENQFAEGEISKVDLSFVKGRFVEALNSENSALQQQLQQEYILELITRMPVRGSQPELIGLPGGSLQSKKDSGSLYQSYYESRLKLASETFDKSNSRLFPSFNVGYFNQQLQGIEGFDGFSLGAKVPLFNVINYQERQLARIAAEQESLGLEQSLWQRQRRLEQLELQRQQIFDQVTDLRLDPEATDDNLEIMRSSYELGEIDMLELSQKVEALSAAEINQLLLLMRLHAIQAEINYLIAE
jgi:cobalt-zinc-cadmium resistance protein CzcA